MKEDFTQEKIIFYRKRVKMKNLLWIPFREEGTLFLLGGEENTQLALSSSKVFTLMFDQSGRSRNCFCFGALTSEHNTSVLSFGESRDKDIFSAFNFGPCFNRTNHWEAVSEKSSPSSVVPVLRED